MELKDIQTAIEEHASATAATIAKLTGQIDGLKANLVEVEQRSADRAFAPGTPIDGAHAVAADLAKNPLLIQVARKELVRTSVEAKASHLLGIERKNTVTGDDAAFFNSTSAGVFSGLTRRRFIRDFLTTVPVSAGSVAWSKETTFTNNAAVQAAGSPLTIAEGVAKNESALVYELQDSRIPTVAHFVKASNQILADVPALGALIDNRLRYGLAVKVDDLIVNGSGSDVKGWTHADCHTAFTPTSGDSGVDSINRAISMLETNEAMATLVLLNPATYRGLQRLKNLEADYIFGSPAGANREAVWNVTVLPTNAVAAGMLLVIDAAQQGEFYLREDARVDVGFDSNDFTKNLVTIRAELRALSVTVRKEAVIYGSLTL